MVPTSVTPENLLRDGLQALRDLLGSDWDVRLRPSSSPEPSSPRGGAAGDAAVVTIHADTGVYAELLVDTKIRITPKDVDAYLLPKAALLRHVQSHTQPFVISPWISPRTQQLLREHSIGYLDLTGNASLRVSRPAIVVHTQGADRAPRSEKTPGNRPQLSGPKAGRLVRLLVDVAPPYRGGVIAKESGLSLPYVSRLLDSLEEQLLIRREGREIVDVDWQGLLRTRAQHLNLLRHNPAVGMLAPNGVQAVWDQLRRPQGQVAALDLAVTGSYAARAVAPLAVGGQLMIYVPHTPHAPDEVGAALGLIRVEESADVLLLRAHDQVIFQRTGDVDGVPSVALSQLVLDCLAGPGRLPAEGEAVLTYMAAHEDSWRRSNLSELSCRQSL